MTGEPQAGADRSHVSYCPRLEIDGAATIELPVALKAGESLVCDGTRLVRVYDAKGRQTSTITLAAPPPVVAAGRHTISFDAAFTGDGTPRVDVTFKTRGEGERVATGRRAKAAGPSRVARPIGR